MALLVPAAAGGETQAEQRHKEGVTSFSKWDFEAARQSFLQAYALEQKPKYLWDLAIAEAKSAHNVEALRHFRKYFKLAAATQADRDKAKPIMEDCERKTARVRVAIPTGAVLLVDGASIDEALLGMPIDVAPGSHTLEARLGDKTKSTTTAPAVGETSSVTLQFDAAPTPAPTTTSAPLPPSGLPADETPPVVGPEPTPSTPVTKYVVVGGLGLAAIGSFVASGLFASASSSAHDDATALLNARACNVPSSSTCNDFNSKRDTANTDKTLSGATLGIGVAFLVAAGVAWFAWPRETAPSKKAWLSPSVGTKGLSLEAGLHF